MATGQRGHDLLLVCNAHKDLPVETDPGRPLGGAHAVHRLNLGVSGLPHPGLQLEGWHCHARATPEGQLRDRCVNVRFAPV